VDAAVFPAPECASVFDARKAVVPQWPDGGEWPFDSRPTRLVDAAYVSVADFLHAHGSQGQPQTSYCSSPLALAMMPRRAADGSLFFVESCPSLEPDFRDGIVRIYAVLPNLERFTNIGLTNAKFPDPFIQTFQIDPPPVAERTVALGWPVSSPIEGSFMFGEDVAISDDGFVIAVTMRFSIPFPAGVAPAAGTVQGSQGVFSDKVSGGYAVAKAKSYKGANWAGVHVMNRRGAESVRFGTPFRWNRDSTFFLQYSDPASPANSWEVAGAAKIGAISSDGNAILLSGTLRCNFSFTGGKWVSVMRPARIKASRSSPAMPWSVRVESLGDALQAPASAKTPGLHAFGVSKAAAPSSTFAASVHWDGGVSAPGGRAATVAPLPGDDSSLCPLAEGDRAVRYVTVQGKLPGHLLNFAELEVFDSTGHNVARNGTASQSSTWADGVAGLWCNTPASGMYVASAANDGDFCTYSSTNYVYAGSGAMDTQNIWRIDLGRSYSDLAYANFWNRAGELYQGGGTRSAFRTSLNAAGALVFQKTLPSNMANAPQPLSFDLLPNNEIALNNWQRPDAKVEVDATASTADQIAACSALCDAADARQAWDLSAFIAGVSAQRIVTPNIYPFLQQDYVLGQMLPQPLANFRLTTDAYNVSVPRSSDPSVASNRAFVSQGDSYAFGSWRVDDAELACSRQPDCAGFRFWGDQYILRVGRHVDRQRALRRRQRRLRAARRQAGLHRALLRHGLPQGAPLPPLQQRTAGLRGGPSARGGHCGRQAQGLDDRLRHAAAAIAGPEIQLGPQRRRHARHAREHRLRPQPVPRALQQDGRLHGVQLRRAQLRRARRDGPVLAQVGLHEVVPVRVPRLGRHGRAERLPRVQGGARRRAGAAGLL
jgi:hypothetical protein